MGLKCFSRLLKEREPTVHVSVLVVHFKSIFIVACIHNAFGFHYFSQSLSPQSSLWNIWTFLEFLITSAKQGATAQPGYWITFSTVPCDILYVALSHAAVHKSVHLQYAHLFPALLSLSFCKYTWNDLYFCCTNCPSTQWNRYLISILLCMTGCIRKITDLILYISFGFCIKEQLNHWSVTTEAGYS